LYSKKIEGVAEVIQVIQVIQLLNIVNQLHISKLMLMPTKSVEIVVWLTDNAWHMKICHAFGTK